MLHCLLLLLTATCVLAFPGGAANCVGPGGCMDEADDGTTGGYVITVEPPVILPTTTEVTVKLSRMGANMTGFLLEATRQAPVSLDTMPTGEVVGTWDLRLGAGEQNENKLIQYRSCTLADESEVDTSAVTHQRDFVALPGEELEFVYTLPDEVSTLYFYAIGVGMGAVWHGGGPFIQASLTTINDLKIEITSASACGTPFPVNEALIASVLGVDAGILDIEAEECEGEENQIYTLVATPTAQEDLDTLRDLLHDPENSAWNLIGQAGDITELECLDGYEFEDGLCSQCDEGETRVAGAPGGCVPLLGLEGPDSPDSTDRPDGTDPDTDGTDPDRPDGTDPDTDTDRPDGTDSGPGPSPISDDAVVVVEATVRITSSVNPCDELRMEISESTDFDVTNCMATQVTTGGKMRVTGATDTGLLWAVSLILESDVSDLVSITEADIEDDIEEAIMMIDSLTLESISIDNLEIDDNKPNVKLVVNFNNYGGGSCGCGCGGK